MKDYRFALFEVSSTDYVPPFWSIRDRNMSLKDIGEGVHCNTIHRETDVISMLKTQKEQGKNW